MPWVFGCGRVGWGYNETRMLEGPRFRCRMNIRLAYGKSGLDVALSEDLCVETIEPRYVAGVPNGAGAVTAALRGPIASKPLREQAKSSDTVGIVVNDITRATPYPVILLVFASLLEGQSTARVEKWEPDLVP